MAAAPGILENYFEEKGDIYACTKHFLKTNLSDD